MNEEWPWPAALDAVIAAPEFHTVLYEDERAGPRGSRPARCDRAPSTHRFGGVLFSSARVISSGGARTARSSSHSGCSDEDDLAPVTHTFENVGASGFHTSTVEMKDT